jgi:cellulose synthase/poly-beta-1,6-N-acetylglucosamine synthase-like glycosyltransferase
MTRDPLVSVLLPVRDGAGFLPEALDSLAAQTLGDFEVVVVDDGSRDSSGGLAEARARDDDRFRVVRQPPLGLVAALEQARAEARGRFLARMDADDIALPRRLECQVDALASDPSLAACGGRVELFPRGTLRDGMRRYERWLNSLVTVERAAADVFVECPIAHPALLVRREAVEAAGGYRERGWPEDYDLVLRLWARGYRFRNVEEPVLRWRDRPERLSRQSAAYTPEAFVRCKVHHLREALPATGEGAVVWGAGPVGKAFACELGRQGVRVRAFVEVDPRKLGRRIYGVPVIATADAPRFEGGLALGAVAGEKARTRVRALVAAQGRREGVDFIAVA